MFGPWRFIHYLIMPEQEVPMIRHEHGGSPHVPARIRFKVKMSSCWKSAILINDLELINVRSYKKSHKRKDEGPIHRITLQTI